jgi:molybdopterin biosynthesis enzyme
MDVAVAEITGRTLAHDLVARTPVAPFDHSAVDGFAFTAVSVSAGLPAVGPRVVPVMADDPILAGVDRVAAHEWERRCESRPL